MTKDNSIYEIVLTEDGSFTLRSSTPPFETMHSMDGAVGETFYVYGPTARLALSSSTHPKILVVGLGVGCIEIMIAGLLVKEFPHVVPEIWSYEKDAHLLGFFRAWVESSEGQNPYARVYDRNAALIAERLGVTVRELKQRLQDLLHSKIFHLEGPLPDPSDLRPSLPAPGPVHGIFFDPFSGKTDSDLWSEETLGTFLRNWAAPVCAFSTYASRGVLHRGLKQLEFQLHDRAGFGQKREMTLATRGISPSILCQRLTPTPRAATFERSSASPSSSPV